MSTSAPAQTPLRKFTFDTVFEGDRVIAPVKPKTTFTAQEVDAARLQGMAEGQRAAVARAEAEAAQAIREATVAIRQAMTALRDLAQAHRSDSARLALAVGRQIAGAALDRFPEAPALAALESLAREVDAQPRLTVRSSAISQPRLEAALTQACAEAGYPGQLIIKVDPTLPPAAFSFDWGEGRAAFDPEAASARIAAALDEALVAEGLHAEPIHLPPEA